MTSLVGKMVKHYKIIEQVGEGGMGVVYKAEDTKLQRHVALKFLPQEWTRDPEAKARFMNEARAASALQHHNICTIHEIDETEDGQMFICMDFYEGETVRAKIERGPLKIDEAIDLAIQIAEGLTKAHQKDIVHRDLKPANVLVTEDGVAKIVDFGLAKLAGRTMLTKEGTTLGTASYMSPEQARGEVVDQRTDIFSLGVLIFEMVTGQQPFQGDYEMAVMYSIMNEDPEPLTGLRTGVPMALEQVINKTLEKDKELRYQNASDLLADLKKISRELETGKKPVVTKRTTVNKGRKWLRILTPLTIVIGVVIAFLLLRPVFQDEPLVSSPKPLVVLPFENQTGDSSFDYLRTAIPNLLITNLEQSKYLTVLTWERMQDLLKLMDKTELDVIDIDKEIGFELCQLEGVQGIVLGSFTRAGDVFATDIKVLDVTTKKLLKSANSKGTGVSSILQKQIDELSQAISTVATLSAPDAEREILKLADVTTHSIEAYRLYLNGVRLFYDRITIDARMEMEKALEFDPTFAMAYYYLSRANQSIGNIAVGDAALRNAKAHADQATVKESLFINMDYATRIEKDRSKALTINQELVKRFPKEKTAHYYLARKYRGLGRNQDAIRAYNQALKLDPNWGNVYNDLGYLYIYAKNYAKSEESFRKYASLSPNQPNPFDSLGELFLTVGRLDDAVLNYKKSVEVNPWWWQGIRKLAYVYALKENYPEFYRHHDDYFSKFEQFLSIDEVPGVMMWGYRQFGVIIFLLGRYQEALEIYQKLEDLALSTGDERTRALAHELKAFVFAEMEDYEGAENQLQASLAIRMRLPNEERPRWQAAKECFSGLLDVKVGKAESAREKLGKVKQALPEITDATAEIYAYWSSFLEAEVLLAEGSPGQAIAVIQQAALPDPFYVIRHPNEYTMPVFRDVVARAYYAMGDLDKAIDEYKRLLKFDEKGQGRFLIDPQYHFRLAKLYEERGWPGLAIQEYQTFLEIWKDADQGLQELRDAKNRLSKLQAVAG